MILQNQAFLVKSRMKVLSTFLSIPSHTKRTIARWSVFCVYVFTFLKFPMLDGMQWHWRITASSRNCRFANRIRNLNLDMMKTSGTATTWISLGDIHKNKGQLKDVASRNIDVMSITLDIIRYIWITQFPNPSLKKLAAGFKEQRILPSRPSQPQFPCSNTTWNSAKGIRTAAREILVYHQESKRLASKV